MMVQKPGYPVRVAWIGRGSREREDFEEIGKSKKDIYKISQCVTSALMSQIAEYCTCYLSYITDIHRYVNSTGLSGIGFFLRIIGQFYLSRI